MGGNQDSVFALLWPNLSIFLVWIIICLMFTGIGFGLMYCLGIGNGKLDVPIPLWLGWCVTIAFLQIWHLFYPITSTSFVLLITGSILGFVSSGVKLKPCTFLAKWRGSDWLGVTLVVLLCFASCFLIANFALGPLRVYDTGLYHLNAIRWAKEYAIIPGLANLHHRLGFNNSNFLYGALLDQGFWTIKSYHTSNSLLWVVSLVSVGLSLPRAVSQPISANPGAFFLSVMFLPVVHQAAWMSTGYAPDAIVFMLEVVLAYVFSGLLTNPPPIGKESLPELKVRVLAIIVLCATTITVKLSAIAFVIPVFVVTLISYIRCLKKIGNRAWKDSALALAFLLSFIIVGSWVLRGYIVSGYPLFPATFAGLINLEWAVPKEVADKARDWVIWYARTGIYGTSQHMDNAVWLKAWFLQQLRVLPQVTIPFILIGLSACIAVAMRITRRSNLPWLLIRRWVLLSIPPIIAMAFCFFTAPDTRFVQGPIWIIAANSLIVALSSLERVVERPLLHKVFRGSILAVLVLLAFSSAATKLNGPAADKGSHPAPIAKLERFETNCGLVVSVPVTTGVPARQFMEDQCWDSSIPCTPKYELNPNLCTRKPKDVNSGFTIRKEQ